MGEQASRVTKIKAVTISAPAAPIDYRQLGEAPRDWQLPTVSIEICIGRLDLPAGALPHEHVIVALEPEILDAIQAAREALPGVLIDG